MVSKENLFFGHPHPTISTRKCVRECAGIFFLKDFLPIINLFLFNKNNKNNKNNKVISTRNHGVCVLIEQKGKVSRPSYQKRRVIL